VSSGQVDTRPVVFGALAVTALVRTLPEYATYGLAVIVCCTVGAGAKVTLPPWLALTTHDPALRNISIRPDTQQGPLTAE
jgi:hypothetical protein